jgi:hypothetical protein
VLFIEYDVGDDGMIEVVGLINAIEESDEDPLGEDWMSWRRSFDDDGLGCVAVPLEDLTLMESTDDPEQIGPLWSGSSWPTERPKKRCHREHDQIAALSIREGPRQP